MEKRILNNVTHKIHYEESDALHFFTSLNKTIPSYKRLVGPFMYNQYLDFVMQYFKEDCMIDWEFAEDEYKAVLIRIKYKNGYVLLLNRRSHNADEDAYIINKSQEKYLDEEHGLVVFPELDIMYNYYDGYPEELDRLILKMRLERSKENNKVNLLCQDPDNGLYAKELPLISTDLTFDLDLHYGEGVAEFHRLALKRITSQSKGLILLHGSPGTGKSYYIRRLIRDLVDSNKHILYMPTNMIDMLGTPVFNNFLMDWVDERHDVDSKIKPGILLVIEDAERVLVKRDINQYGSDGVSNILNSSDGILNDFLNIQVLATFNSDISMIDSAIMRKKRALAIKEFGKLDKSQSQRVIDHYKIDYQASGPMCLADIFSLMQDADDQVLLPSANTKNIGFAK